MALAVNRLALLLACLLSAALCGCGRVPDRADFVFLNGAEPESIDPAVITGQPDGRVAYALFEGLTVFGADGGVEPGVAERWEISPDGRVYTFYLRHNSKWSNGETVTARDFVPLLEARTVAGQRQPSTPTSSTTCTARKISTKATSPTSIRSASRSKTTSPSRSPSITPHPSFSISAPFATLLPGARRIHRALRARAGVSWTKPGNLVGNGAFTLKEWRLFDRIRVVKSETYWNKDHVGMKSVDILPLAVPMTAFNFYATGLADYMGDKAAHAHHAHDRAEEAARLPFRALSRHLLPAVQCAAETFQ
ncbi:MAG: ABC transporter substrate-binding protein [Anaeromyxobacter sp.]